MLADFSMRLRQIACASTPARADRVARQVADYIQVQQASQELGLVSSGLEQRGWASLIYKEERVPQGQIEF